MVLKKLAWSCNFSRVICTQVEETPIENPGYAPKRGTTISERMGGARVNQIESNRHYLRTIAEMLLVCSQQEIALRGHRESLTSDNRGKYLSLLQTMISSFVKYLLMVRGMRHISQLIFRMNY